MAHNSGGEKGNQFGKVSSILHYKVEKCDATNECPGMSSCNYGIRTCSSLIYHLNFDIAMNIAPG